MRVAGIAVACVMVAGCASDELGSKSAALVDPGAFTLPMLSATERAEIVHRYAALDPGGVVPRGFLEDAIVYFDVNKALIPKTDYFVVVDMSRYSGKDRFWLVDLASGVVESHKVAHGDGSDPDNNGTATLFGNTDGSHMTSLGFALTGEVYDGTHPHSMRLDGLSPDGSPNQMANTNVRPRLIVVHPADYVSDSNTSQQGRSNGCLALDPAIEASVVDRIHDGSLVYTALTPLASPVGPGDCGAIDAAGGVVDNGEPCFVTGGPAFGLHQETTAGMNGSLMWTHATARDAEQNFAQWNLDVAEAGRYRVEVYTDTAFAQSQHASYGVHAAGADYAFELDQTAQDGYQTLGELDFAQGPDQFVHLGDNTGEAGGTVQLVFDAVRLTRIDGGTGPADGGSGSNEPGKSGGCATGGGGSLALVLLALSRAARSRGGRRPAAR